MGKRSAKNTGLKILRDGVYYPVMLSLVNGSPLYQVYYQGRVYSSPHLPTLDQELQALHSEDREPVGFWFAQPGTAFLCPRPGYGYVRNGILYDPDGHRRGEAQHYHLFPAEAVPEADKAYEEIRRHYEEKSYHLAKSQRRRIYAWLKKKGKEAKRRDAEEGAQK